MRLYVETSALAKLYVTESESSDVESLIDSARPWLYTSRVTYPEVLSLLTRSLRDRRLDRRHYVLQKRTFLDDWLALHIVELTESSLLPAERIIERFGLRGFDAVHLCSALCVQADRFVCFDDRLRTAAAAMGLAVMP